MSKTIFNTILAFILVAAGVFLLLINLGLLPLDMLEVWEYFYPLIFLLLGLKWTLDGFAYKRRRGNHRLFGWFWGLTFLTLGSLLLLNKLGQLNFTLGQVWQLWPLLLVYLGINILYSRTRPAHIHVGDKGRKFREDVKEKGSFGSMKYDQPNWKVEPMDIQHGVGDYYFDFTRAFIPEEETLIRLSGWVGNIDIILPKDLAFSAVARSSVGDLDILGTKQEGINPNMNYKTIDYDEAERKLTFEFDYKVLDLKIDRV